MVPYLLSFLLVGLNVGAIRGAELAGSWRPGSLSESIDDLLKLVDKDWIVKIRRTIHKYPEVGLKLPLTADFLVAELASRLNITGLKRHWCGGSGLVFDIGTGKHPIVLLRADMDALPMHEDTGLEYQSKIPGRMHACGHDSHTAMVMGAAQIVKARESEIDGTVRFMFQPGEEGYNGAQIMIDEGLLEQNGRPDFALALHVLPILNSAQFLTGSVWAGGCVFNITVSGITSHAAQPAQGKDPISISTLLIQTFNSIIARETIGGISTRQVSIISVTQIHAGTAHNLIPDHVDLAGTVRAMTENQLKFVKRRINETVRAFETMFENTISLHFYDELPPIVINAGLVELLRPILQTDPSMPNGEFQYGLEDFALISREIPSALYLIGTQGQFPLHNSKFAILNDTNILPRGATFLAASAFQLLETKALHRKRHIDDL